MQKNYDKSLEDLLESIQLLIDNSLSKVPKEQIKVCRITDNSDRKNGHYKVTVDGNVVYDAYTEKITYVNDEYVNVLFPINDTERKTILSRYLSDDFSSSLAYVSTKEKIVQYQGAPTCALVQDSSISIAANGRTSSKLIGSWDLKGAPLLMSDVLYLTADFTSLLKDLNVRTGNYGILVEGLLNDAVVFSGALDSSTMFGDPYQLLTPTPQEVAIRFEPGKLELGRIDFYLYQASNFKYLDVKDNELKRLETSALNGVEIETISVHNLKAYFACSAETAEDNTVKLYSDNMLTYKQPNYEKTVNLLWFNKDPDTDKVIGFHDGVFSERARYTKGEITSFSSDGKRTFIDGKGYDTPQDFDVDIGTWVYCLDGQIIDIVDEQDINSIFYMIDWFVSNDNGDLVQQTEFHKTSILVTCSSALVKTSVTATVWCNGIAYKPAATLDFENQDAIAQSVYDLANTKLNLKHGFNSRENYNIYDSVSKCCLDSYYTSRELVAEWENLPSSVTEDMITYEWVVPVERSMIELARTEGNVLIYRIATQFIESKTNNTIQCIATITNQDGASAKIQGEAQLNFSTFGSYGTEYSVVFSKNEDLIYAYAVDKNGVRVENTITKMRWKFDEEWPTDVTESISVAERGVDTYNLIEAQVSINRDLVIYGYYAHQIGDYESQLPAAIIYDNTGSNPTYYSGEWKLFDLSGEEVSDVRWRIRDYSYGEDEELGYIDVKDGKYSFEPLYIDCTYLAIEAYSLNNAFLFNYPIYIGRNQHSSALLNDWDGGLVIQENIDEYDKKESYVLAPMFGAGIKNSDNTFSGVVMGSLNIINDSAVSKVGLFGYEDSVQTYELNASGEARFGPPGGGQILIDGGGGVIQSGSWSGENKTGSCWDLGAGSFELYPDIPEQRGQSIRSHFSFIDGKLSIAANELEIIALGEVADVNQIPTWIDATSLNESWALSGINVSVNGRQESLIINKEVMDELQKNNRVKVATVVSDQYRDGSCFSISIKASRFKEKEEA